MAEPERIGARIERMDVGRFAVGVWAYCRALRGSVTSWVRSPAHNHQVGGVPESPHTYGVGADVVYDAFVPYEQAQAIGEDLGLAVIREKDHDHLQPMGWRVPAVRR